MRSARLAVVLDCCCVLVFVIIGRASHTKGESLAGIASTAWPFLAGLAGGWLGGPRLAAAVRAFPGGRGRVARHGGRWHGAPGGVRAGHGASRSSWSRWRSSGLFLLGWRLAARLADGYLRRGQEFSRPLAVWCDD